MYAQLGISLPRTANEQMNATRRVSQSGARPGDLVFFVSGGRAYHDGIYAGNGMTYDSPRSGKSVSKREIWDATIVFGRVTGRGVSGGAGRGPQAAPRGAGGS